jgi:CRP-like cAMP-binding protein
MTLDAGFKLLDRRVFFKGDIIVKEGEEGLRAYLIEQGSVEVFRTVGDRRIVIGKRGKGNVLGEMALIDNSRRVASAIALEKTTCVVIARAEFERMVIRASPLMKGLLRVLVANVRSLDEMVVGMGGVGGSSQGPTL